MHEEILEKYFKGEVDADQLIDDLVGSSVRWGSKETSLEIVRMHEKFIVKPQHIIKLLHDMLDDKIEPEYLEMISFALMGSDNFTWDFDDKCTNIMLDIFHEWASPELYYELNIENVTRCLKKLKDCENK